MEAIGAASAILTFIDIAQKLLVACYRLRGQWKDYERDISELISEVERLSDICEELQEIVDEADGQKTLSQLPPPATATNQKGGSALTACHSALEACTSVLKELSDKLTPLTRARFRDKLKWPFESGNVAKKVEFIQNQKSTLELALSTYQTKLLTTHSRKTDDRYLKEKREKLLRWFKTSDPEQNHLTSRESHEPGTGQWIFENENFKRWVNHTGGLLWLHGIPGAGKTVLCSTVIDHLQTRPLSQPHRSHPGPDHVLYYYFTFSDHTKQSLANLLKFTIYQLIANTQEFPEVADTLYDSKNQGSNEPSIKELIETLAAIASACAGDVYLLVDALDECPGKERKAFYERALGPILATKVKLMIASRKEPDIEEALRNRSLYEICIQNDDVNADVRAHVNSVISRDPKFQVMKLSIQEEILDGVVSGARGMFRWAVCQLEVIRQCLTPAMVRERLKTMPTDLDQTYDRILHLIPDFHRPFVQSALRWLAFSERPLLLEELAEAAVVQPGETFDSDSSRLLSQNMVVDLCGVLVSSSTIHHSPPDWLTDKRFYEGRDALDHGNQEHLVITLSHYSVKEYLTSKSLQCGALSSFHASVTLCNSYLAQCCLTYILSFNGGAFARTFDFAENPLLGYACRYWMTHWKNASTDDEEPPLRSLVERMFQIDAPEAYGNWLNVFDPDRVWYNPRAFHKSIELHPQTLYWATSLGHVPLVRALVEKGADINKAEGRYGSVFGAAVFHGHLGIVKFLLQRGANLSLHAPELGSMLQIAVLGGNYEVFEFLIKKGVDIDVYSTQYKTPLVEAILKRRYGMVDLLISRGANIQARPLDNRCPLYYAALTGDSSLVKKLLDAGADVNRLSNFGDGSPLDGAVISKSITLVKTMIQEGAVINGGSLHGLLLKAIDTRHVGMVQTLLEAGGHSLSTQILQVALKRSIKRHSTAIFHALLDAGADNNKLNTKFEELLAIALLSGEFDMARTLMERGLAEYDAPAVVAATQIYKSEPYFLEVLLQDHNIDINIQATVYNLELYGSFGFNLPLHIAIQNEDEKAIWVLLRRNPDVNAIGGGSGWTPLSLAISHGLLDIAKELIRRGAAVDRKVSWSPFEMAVRYACVSKDGSFGMINLLLDLGVKVNNGNENALWWPLEMEKYFIIEYLVAKGMGLNQSMESPGFYQKDSSWDVLSVTPIQYAATKGNLKMIQFLLNLGADINGYMGKQGPTLVCGLKSNNRIVVEFLLDNGAILEGTDCPSAIHLAITMGFRDLVPKLLSYGADVNANNNGESPLAAAFRAKDDLLITMLRSYGAVFLSSDSKILRETIKDGTIEELRKLFHFGLSPDASQYDWHNGLSKAVSERNYEVLECLIEAGATISKVKHMVLLDQVFGAGNTKVATFVLNNSDDLELSVALAKAVGVADNYKIVKMLLARGAAVNGACFEEAIHAGTEMITYLLDVPMTTSQRSEYLGRALQSAVFEGYLPICNWLIDDCGADINHRGAPHGTALRAAIRAYSGAGTAGVGIEMLVSRGVNVNPAPVGIDFQSGGSIGHEETRTYSSPLSKALTDEASTKSLVRFLLAHGADVNLIGGEYHVPLQAAAYWNSSMIGDILDSGADINAVGGRFGTALHAAACRHDVDAVKLLLSRGAGVRIIAGKYGSALHCAAHGESVGPNRTSPGDIRQTMDLLLEAGADVNIQCGEYVKRPPYGSAVQAAAAGGNLEALKWLMAHGADIRVRGGKWGNVYRAALKDYGKKHNNVGGVPWDIISWLEYHYGRDGWEDDTKD
ncbi:ankyrin repeat-containing domain protein [Xylaria digitata]|nr:ankyrin repeat-containing domain protein [Xylaria digitata]